MRGRIEFKADKMIKKRIKVNLSNKRNKVILVKAGNSYGRLPHALLSLAANLSNEVLILDEATPELVMSYRDKIKNAICVGISTATGPQIQYSLEVAQAIRAINSHIPIVWGGYHPSLKPTQTLENEYVDKVIVGQGEQAFHDLVKNIRDGNSVDDIIAYDYIDKENFPIYDFNLVDMNKYIIPYVSSRTISLYASQGCPFKCKFCAVNSVYGTKYSGWKVEQVVDLVAFCVRKYLINGVHFDDENFFVGKKRALKFASLLLKRGLHINWSADARVDILCHLQSDEWEILDRSGCKRLLVGAESGSQTSLDKLNKRITPEMILELGSLCSKHAIVPCFSMMVGLPGERPEDIEKTFQLIDIIKEKVPTSELLLFLYTPYPGTPLYNLSLKMGFKEPQSLKDWAHHYLDTPTTPWIARSLVERVKKYRTSLPLHRDISLKFKEKFSFRVYIHRFSKQLSRKDKKDAILRYLNRLSSKTK